MAIERVLIVDSEDANQLFFQMLFNDLGIEEFVFTARTGGEGLDIVEREHIQFIVVAWELGGGMPGTVFIQKARMKRKRKYLPCLIYSKRMTHEEVVLTKELGFKNILDVPFDKPQAKELVKTMIDQEDDLDPTELKLRKIESYLFEEKPGEALRLLSDQLFQGAHRVRAYTVAAEIWFRMGNLDKVETLLEKALKAQEDYYPACQLKAKLLSRLGKHEEAIKYLQDMSKNSPKNLSTMVGLGEAYVGADKFDEAKKVFNDVINIDDDNQKAKDGLATVAVTEGNIPLALQLVAETESGNDMARTFNNMAIAQVGNGEYEKAILTYHNAITVLADKAKLSRLYFNLGLAWKKMGKLENGFKSLAESYILEPEFEKSYAWISKVFQELREKNIQPDKELVAKIKAVRNAYKEKKEEE